MTKGLQTASQGGFDTIVLNASQYGGGGETSYSPIGGCISMAAMQTATYTNQQNAYSLKVDAGFTASNMLTRVTGTGGGSNPTVAITNALNDNGAQGQIACVIPAGSIPTTGWQIGTAFSDNGMHDIFLAGDIASFQFSFPGGGTGSACYPAVVWQSDYASGNVVPLAANPTGSTGPSINTHATRWMPAVGEWWLGVGGGFSGLIPGVSANLVPCVGVWSGLKTLVTSNSGGTAGRSRNYQSVITSTYYTAGPISGTMGTSGTGDYGHQIITMADNLTVGASPVPIADGGHTDLVHPGQFMYVELNSTNNASSTTGFGPLGSTFTPSNPNSTPMMIGGQPVAGTTSSTTATQWNQIFNGEPRISTNTQEALTPCPTAGYFSGLTCCLHVASGTISSQFYINDTLDKQTATGAQQITGIVAQTAMADNGYQDIIKAGQVFASTYTGLTTSSTLQSQSVTFSTGAHSDNMLMLGVG